MEDAPLMSMVSDYVSETYIQPLIVDGAHDAKINILQETDMFVILQVIHGDGHYKQTYRITALTLMGWLYNKLKQSPVKVV